jgi:hypothetical protein
LSQQIGALARALRVGVATEREHCGDDEQKQLSQDEHRDVSHRSILGKC